MGSSWLEIDAGRLVGNVRAIRGRLERGARVMAVVKANAYGHGSRLVSPLLADHVDWFGVDSLGEALEIHALDLGRPILILGHTETENLETVVRLGFRQALFRRDSARAMARAAQRIGKPAFAHLKIETGLNRLGGSPSDIDLSGIQIEGVYTHFADVENGSSDFYRIQLERLREAASSFEGVLVHASPTAGVLLHPDAHCDLARVGIGLYGIWPSPDSRVEVPLKPVLTWKSRLAQVKRIPRGASVGYDCTYRAESDRVIGVVPVGYYDGYDRKLSNRGYVLVRGGRAEVVGRVAMNMFMVDVTGLGAEDDDEVVLLGDGISADELARLSDTIAYEVVARLNPLLPRKLI
ncbi:MAG TPA: alanine racemase [Vicinamibacteria bacterium]|nr:alanine racemase [Vicinamibacteria bacterium]